MFRNFICSFFAVFLLFNGLRADSETEAVFGLLDPCQVHISGEEVYVIENQKLHQINSIFSNGDSLYYAKFPSGEKPWMCPNCDFINVKNAITCDNCNWDPRKDPIPFR